MASWLEALSAPDLGIVIAGDHFAATQTMDEEQRQTVNFNGAFGVDGAACRSIRRADENTVSMSAILLEPGQNAGLDDESKLYDLKSFQIACRRGSNNWFVHNDCVWNRIAVSSTLDQVTLSADFTVPRYDPTVAGARG